MNPDVEHAPDPPKDLVGALLKACSLLGNFGADRPEWTLNDLTSVSGMNKTTVHRLMATFIHAGWIERTPAGAYHTTVRMFEIGSSALVGLDLRSAARTHLNELAATFGDTAFLMVPADEGAVCIDKIDGTASLVIAGINVGTVLPYHAAAGPVVMLSHSPALRARWIRGSLKEFTDRTLTEPATLTRHLDEVRDAGYAFSNADYLEGVAAVAAPIFDQAGEVLASISIGGRAEAFAGDMLAAKVAHVRHAATRISAILDNAAPRTTPHV